MRIIVEFALQLVQTYRAWYSLRLIFHLCDGGRRFRSVIIHTVLIVTNDSYHLGGLLAAAIANMDGIGGKPAWAWIFILEGLFTVLVGIASFWVVQDFPDTAKFLTEDERTATRLSDLIS